MDILRTIRTNGETLLNYSDYCRYFYFGGRTSRITGCKSEAKIAEYFLRNVLKDTVTEKIISLMEKRFLKQHDQFLSNPMLLTFIIIKHPMLRSFYGKCCQFYKTAYEAIVIGHDEEKIVYGRIFRSAADAEEFIRMFREFCAKSYRQCMFEFDKAAFEKLFNALKSKERLSNPGIMKRNRPSMMRALRCA